MSQTDVGPWETAATSRGFGSSTNLHANATHAPIMLVAAAPPPPVEPPQPVPALTQRTGQTLAQLLQLTNDINARRGSLITHEMPAGLTASQQQSNRRASAVGGRQGRLQRQQQQAARRSTWAESKSTAAAAAAASPPVGALTAAIAAPSPPSGPAPAPAPALPSSAAYTQRGQHVRSRSSGGGSRDGSDRFTTGASAARRFSTAAGLDPAVAFAPSSLSGAEAADAIGAAETAPSLRQALLQAAKVRALTPAYARRGGGVLVASADLVSGVDPATGRSVLQSEGSASARDGPGGGDTTGKTTPRVVMEEDGLARGQEYLAPRLRASRWASQHGTLVERKRAIANWAPKRTRKTSEFRAQLLRESAALEEGATAAAAAAAVAVTAAPVAALLPAGDDGDGDGEDHSNIAARPQRKAASASTSLHRRSQSALDSSSLSRPLDHMSILSKPGAQRTEAEVSYLSSWLRVLPTSSPFFTSLAGPVLTGLARVVGVESFPGGQWIFRQGQRGEHFYVVLQGRVAIVIDKSLKQGEVAGQNASAAAAAAAGQTGPVLSAAAEAAQGALQLQLQRSPSNASAGSGSSRPGSASTALLRPGSALASGRPPSSPLSALFASAARRSSSSGGMSLATVAAALLRSPRHSSRPGSAAPMLRSPPSAGAAAVAVSRRSSLPQTNEPVVREDDAEDEGEGDNGDDAVERAVHGLPRSPAPPLAAPVPSPSRPASASTAASRKLVRAARLLTIFSRVKKRAGSTGALDVAACLSPSAGVGGAALACSPPQSRPRSGAQTPATLLTPQRSVAALASSPRQSQTSLGSASSPRLRPSSAMQLHSQSQSQAALVASSSSSSSTVISPTAAAAAAHEIHSPRGSSAHSSGGAGSAAAGAGAAGAGAGPGPVLTLQQQELGLCPSEIVVAEAGAGAGFGEVALLSQSSTRQASVLALPSHGPCLCLCLHRAAYDGALRAAQELALNYKINFARELFLFRRWSYDKLLQFSLCFLPAGGEPHYFPRGHVFYLQGDARCDKVFFVVSGRVEIRVEDSGGRAAWLSGGEEEWSGTESDGDGGGGGGGRSSTSWIGANYIRDEEAEARRASEAHVRAAEDRARLRAARATATAPQSLLLRAASASPSRSKAERRRVKSKKDPLRHVQSRYMDTTASARQKEVLKIRAPSQRERDEARALAAEEEAERRADGGMGGGTGAGGGVGGSSRWWTFDRGSSDDRSDGDDSDSTTSSSSASSSSTDTSCSDDDAYTVSRRAERKRAKLAARRSRRGRKHRRGASGMEAVYDGMAHVELAVSGSGGLENETGAGAGAGAGAAPASVHAHMPADGATSYHFYKLRIDKRDFDSVAHGELVLRVTLTPLAVRTPAAGAAAAGAKAAPPHERFGLFAGNGSCRYPSKHRHTWASARAVGDGADAAPGKGTGATGDAPLPRPYSRSIILRPGSDPNISTGHLYLSVFHPQNESAILAHQARHNGALPAPRATPLGAPETAGPPYELRVERRPAAGRQWGGGGAQRPPRIYRLANLGPLDMFGAEEVVVQHEASAAATTAAAAAAAAAAARAQGRPGSARPRPRDGLNYAELGRISSAVVSSPGGARVFLMDRAAFMNHCRGNMLSELKALLRKQLRRRARALEKQRRIEEQTEAKVPAPRRYDLARPARATLPRARPQSAHPLSQEAAAVASAAAGGGAPQAVPVDASAAAPFHHRPNLSAMTVLTQRERAALEHAFRRERNQAKLKIAVLEKFYSHHPDAAALLELQHGEAEARRLLLPPGAGDGGGGGGGGVGKHGHELWVLDPNEQVQARRRAKLLKLQAEEQAEQSVHWKDEEGEGEQGAAVQSATLRLMPPSASRPATAPLHRLKAAEPAPQPLLLMAGATNGPDASLAPLPRSEPVPLDQLLPPPPGSPTMSLELQPSHGLNPGTYRTLRRDEKTALEAQNQVALRLFGRKINDFSAARSPVAATAAATDAQADGAAEPLSPRQQQRAQSARSAIRDGPVFGLAGSSPHAGTLSRHGMRMSIDAGLRNHWQRERATLMASVRQRAERRAHSGRERPFADPSLQNPWIYIPSLFDSAAEDPALNQLAVQLGIPQPKPVAQPRDRERAHRKPTLGPDGAPLLDEEAVEAAAAAARALQGVPEEQQQQTSPTKRQADANKPTVEEALRLAELRAAAKASDASAAAALAEEKEQLGAPDASHRQGLGPSRPSTASGPGRAVVACPVADSLWQSDLAVLNSARPPPRGTPFVAHTELAHMANFVLFEPKHVASTVPLKYRNKERMEKEAAAAAEDQRLLMHTLAPVAAAAAVKVVGATTGVTLDSDANSTPPRRLVQTARPGSAPMFGSFARTVPVAAAQPAAAPVHADHESTAAHESDNAAEDDHSTIFSLTQVGAQQSLPNSSRPVPAAHSSGDTALVLHADAAASSSPCATDGEEEAEPTFPRRMTAAAAAAAAAATNKSSSNSSSGLFLIPSVIRPLEGVAQHVESASEQTQKEAIVAFLQEQRASLTLTARIHESERTLSGRGVSAAPRPHSAQAVLRATRRAHSAHRPRRPPTIPSRTRPPAEASALAHMELLRRKQAQVQAAKAAAFPRAFRTVGRRKDLAFFTPTALLNPHAVTRPPLHPSSQSCSRLASAAAVSHYADEYPEPHYASAADAFASPLASLWSDLSSSPLMHPSAAQMAEWERVDVVEEGERDQPLYAEEQSAEESKQRSPPSAAAAPPLQPWHQPQSQPQYHRHSPSPPLHPRPASAASTMHMATPVAPAPPAGARPTSAFPRPPSRTAVPRGKVRPQSAITGLTQMEELE